MPSPSLVSLHCYPVKSCRGHALVEAPLDVYGLVGDRRWLVIDEQGHALTQRTLPRLALIEPSVAGDRLVLHVPGASPLSIPSAGVDGTPPLDVVIWRDTVKAVDLGAEAAAWLAAYLGRPTRLVGMASDYYRPVHKAAAHPGDVAAFSDAVPLLVISEGSLADLNSRLDHPVPMDRFRPNLVIRGCPAFAEDGWRRIRIGGVVLRAAGPSIRCIVTTTDQQSLERSKEPLRTLARYRRSDDGDVLFGQNYIHETKTGVLRTGLDVEVLE